jgi:hypothetical protein
MTESLFQIEFASAAVERLVDRFHCSGKAVMPLARPVFLRDRIGP